MMQIQRILGAQRTSYRVVVIAAMMGAGLMLAGCGQKGPLYLAAKQAPEQPATASASEKPAR